MTSRLQALNESIFQAEEAGKTEELALILHEDFFIVCASGVREGQVAFLDAVLKNANRGRQTDQVNIRLYGDCAVYTCRVTTTVDKNGNPTVGYYQNLRVFIQQPGALALHGVAGN